MNPIALHAPLIVERIKAGLAAARAQGRVGGNLALRSRDPAVLGRIVAAREGLARHKPQIEASYLLPTVRNSIPTKG